MPTTELTFGQELMGLTFNPSGDPKVQRLKELFAEIADIVNEHPASTLPASYSFNLIKGNALREILNAQMNSVKLVTFQK